MVIETENVIDQEIGLEIENDIDLGKKGEANLAIAEEAVPVIGKSVEQGTKKEDEVALEKENSAQ